MKLGLKRRIYNAEIRNRRLSLGLSQRELSAKIKVSSGMVGQIETLRVCKPSHPTIIKLAAFFGVDPETLCPEWLGIIKDVPKEYDSQADFTPTMLRDIATKYQALPSPEVECDREMLKDAISAGCKALTFREKAVLEMRYGLNGKGRTLTLKETGEVLGLQRERVRQIEARAIRKLQKPCVSRNLIEYMEPQNATQVRLSGEQEAEAAIGG